MLNYGRPIPPDTARNEAEADVVRYLAGVAAVAGARPGGGHLSLESFVLAEGRFFRAGPSSWPGEFGDTGHCFENAMWRALRDEIRYVEGFAVAPAVAVPVLHAWCVDRDGVVVDPTWAYHNNAAYYGVEIDVDVAWDVLLSLGRWGVLAGNAAVLKPGSPV